jgi:CubicO group peptidase (beta-lactamase class C family)
MTEVHGTCDDRFTAMRDLLAANLASGADLGASVAVTLDGEPVVDLWGGWADTDQTMPWTQDTITNVWSTTKTMTFVTALVLADRGELDVDAPVARYWPEFAAAGKAGVLVRHVLGHTSGLSGWEQPITAEDFEDWEKCTSLLAAQAPWWEPGTVSGYHAVTQGYLIGEIVRRITGQSFGAFFAKELAGPLGADFHVGLDPVHFDRVSNVIPNPPMEFPADVDLTSVAARTFINPPMDARFAHTSGWRRAEIPAANGHGNARSVAAVQSIVSNGGVANGTRFVSDRTLARIFEVQAQGVDQVLGIPAKIGLGYGLNGEETPISPNPRACFWGGWGGSLCINDLDARVTITYMMNKMGQGTTGDERGGALVGAVYAGLLGG